MILVMPREGAGTHFVGVSSGPGLDIISTILLLYLYCKESIEPVCVVGFLGVWRRQWWYIRVPEIIFKGLNMRVMAEQLVAVGVRVGRW